MLRSRGFKIGALIALGALGGYLWTWHTPAVYRSRAQVIQLSSPDTPRGAAMLFTGQAASPLGVLEGIFDNPEMKRRVSEEVGVTVPELQRMAFVLADPLTSQLELVVDSPRPDQARQILGVALRVARDLETQTSHSAAALEARQLKQVWESEQMHLTRQAAQFRDALRDHASVGVTAEDVSTALSERQRVERDLAAQEIRLSALERKLRGTLNDGELPQAGHLESLRDHLKASEQALAEAQSALGPDSPELNKKSAAVESARQVYEIELRRARESVRSGLLAEIGPLRAEVRALRTELTDRKSDAGKSPKSAALMAAHQRRLDQARERVAAAQLKFELARIDAEVERVTWSVLTPPSTESRPINKRFARNPAAGAVLGALLGFALFWPRRRPPALTLKEEPCPNAA